MTPMVGRCFVVTGDDEFLIAREVTRIVAGARASNPQLEVTQVAADQLVAGALAELFSPSLFAEARLIVIADVQDAAKPVVETLVRQSPQLPAEITLVVSHGGGAKGRATVDALRKAGATVRSGVKPARHRDRLDFIRGEIAAAGGRATSDAIDALAEAVGGNLRELATVCAQLVADSAGEVDAAAVRRYHRGRAEATGFSVADAVMVGDLGGALEATRWALSVGIDPVLIADALADGVRSVAKVAATGEGSSQRLASTLGMPPWKIDRVRRQARGWSPAAITAAMHTATRLNADVKGGAEDRAYVLERAVCQMVEVRRA